MEDFRSKSCRDGRMMQIEGYNNGGAPTSMNDLRSYSYSTSSSVHPPHPYPPMGGSKEVIKIKKSGNLGSTSKSWSFNDPELQRKKRVAGYKVYTVEGKMKGSLRKSFRWIKDKVYGWRLH